MNENDGDRKFVRILYLLYFFILDEEEELFFLNYLYIYYLNTRGCLEHDSKNIHPAYRGSDTSSWCRKVYNYIAMIVFNGDQNGNKTYYEFLIIR